MCPPASVVPPIELNDYSTEEVVFKVLTQLQSGSSLPSNVLPDVDPYQFPPSNLPAEMWYFCSGTKKDAENGFWRSMGDACEIYSSSAIIGSRKTLQFYEGRAPNGEKTNWIMQEYTTTDKISSKPDPRALYRVFLVDEGSSGRISKSELLEKNMDDLAGPSKAGAPDVALMVGNRSPGVEDYLSSGDYISLDDLATPLSRSSSSADSSCMTMSSEGLFDSDALLCEMGEDPPPLDQAPVIQQPKINLNLSAPAKLKQVVVQPTTLEAQDSRQESKPCTGQTSRADRTEAGETNNVGPSNTSAPSSSSSSSSEGSTSSRNRTKKRKMMKYLCFLAF